MLMSGRRTPYSPEAAFWCTHSELTGFQCESNFIELKKGASITAMDQLKSD